MSWQSLFLPFAANALLTFLHHAFYVRPAQIKIKELSVAQNAKVAAVVSTADAALLNAVDKTVGAEVNKLSTPK